jgi:hypothetical protein
VVGYEGVESEEVDPMLVVVTDELDRAEEDITDTDDEVGAQKAGQRESLIGHHADLLSFAALLLWRAVRTVQGPLSPRPVAYLGAMLFSRVLRAASLCCAGPASAPPHAAEGLLPNLHNRCGCAPRMRRRSARCAWWAART